MSDESDNATVLCTANNGGLNWNDQLQGLVEENQHLRQLLSEAMNALEIMAMPVPESAATSKVEIEMTAAAKRLLTKLNKELGE